MSKNTLNKISEVFTKYIYSSYYP